MCKVRRLFCFAGIRKMNEIFIKVADSDNELEEVFSIRKEVFVEEQRLFQGSDRDEYDHRSIFLVAKSDASVLGTVRIFPLGEGRWQGGRLAVRKIHRGSLAGCFLVKAAVQFARAKGATSFTALIQDRNVHYFSKLGWRPFGGSIAYHGLPHQMMEADLSDEEDGYEWFT
jgi:putative N-acetyltransferase (TIGR04045 family)